MWNWSLVSFWMWRVQCGGVSVRTYAYDKCNIDLVQGQYRAEYLPSRLRRSGRYSPVLPLYSVNITYVLRGQYRTEYLQYPALTVRPGCAVRAGTRYSPVRGPWRGIVLVLVVEVEGVTQGETIYTHVKYALKFKVSSIIFLQISVFLLTKCWGKLLATNYFSLARFHLVPAASICCCNFRLNFLLSEGCL